MGVWAAGCLEDQTAGVKADGEVGGVSEMWAEGFSS